MDSVTQKFVSQILTECLIIAHCFTFAFFSSNIQSLRQSDKVLSDRRLGVAATQLAGAVVAVGHCCCQLGAVAVAAVVGLWSLLDTGHGGGRGLGDDGAPLA